MLSDLGLPGPWSLAAALLFGAIGFVALSYGRKTGRWRLAGWGVVLLVYPYFVERAWLSWAIGLAICAAMYWWRD